MFAATNYLYVCPYVCIWNVARQSVHIWIHESAYLCNKSITNSLVLLTNLLESTKAFFKIKYFSYPVTLNKINIFIGLTPPSLEACLLCDWFSSEASPFIPVLLCAHFAPEQSFQGFAEHWLCVGVSYPIQLVE